MHAVSYFLPLGSTFAFICASALFNSAIIDLSAAISARAAARSRLATAILSCVSRASLGEGYARTLEEWQLRFQDAWPATKALGFDERFKRTWEYYLAYCQAGFEAGALNVGL